MNTKISHKATAMLLAFLMFTTSISFSMDIHFCGGQIESIAFFGNTTACEMMQQEKEPKSCCESPKKQVKTCYNKETAKSNCCHNQKVVVENGDFEKTDFNINDVQPTIALVAFVYTYFKPLVFTSINKVSYTDYNTPPITEDITILHQVFRI